MTLRRTDFLVDDSTPNDLLFNFHDHNGELKGRGYEERDFKVHPQEMYDPPSEIGLIAESDWSDLIKKKEQEKSCLSHIRDRAMWGQPFPSLDQNGQGYCATEDTEVLTENGWIAYPEYNWTDLLGTVNPLTHQLEFQPCLKKHVYEYEGDMIYSTNRRLDFGVTPDHRMLVRKWDERKRTLSNNYSFVRARDLGWYTGLMHAPKGYRGTELVTLGVEGDREYSGDDFIHILALIISDGYAGGSESTKNWVSFCCFDERYQEVSNLARRLGFKESPTRKGVWTRYDANSLAQWVRENCYLVNKSYKAQHKKIPDIIKVASGRQIRNFLNYFGDRSKSQTGVQFWTTSKRLADDIQELYLKIGKRVSIGKALPQQSIIKSGENEGKVINSRECYTLTVADADRLCLDRKKHLEVDHYKGLVYCATVPNSTLVTRRNGSVLISGNCWYYSTTACVMLLRAINNQPYVRLSAHAGAWVIKNGRNEGGWCGLSAERQKTHGTPSVEFWPEKSMSGSHNNSKTWENAALHKVTEDWIDIARPVYDRNLTFNQLATCLLLGIPCAVDFNWWGHSVCAMDLVEVERGSYGIRILNSWTDSYGDRGTSVIRGDKARPNGAVALRVTGASAA